MQNKKRKNSPLNKKGVFEAANRLAAALKMPTIKDLRAELGGSGSETTLHKYLNQWKIALLKMAHNLENDSVPDNEKLGISKEKKKTLEQAFKDQLSEKKILSVELIKSEKENLNLKVQNQHLEKDLKVMTEEHKILTVKCEHLEKLCQAITQERQAMATAVLCDQNQKIEALQQELRQINKDSLEQIKKMGFEGDDAIIREKVKTINLEDKVHTLTEQVKALEKNLTIEKAASESLRQYIKAQKAVTQKMVTSVSLQQPTTLSEG